jgi:hypothetical protein
MLISRAVATLFWRVEVATSTPAYILAVYMLVLLSRLSGYIYVFCSESLLERSMTVERSATLQCHALRVAITIGDHT